MVLLLRLLQNFSRCVLEAIHVVWHVIIVHSVDQLSDKLKHLLILLVVIRGPVSLLNYELLLLLFNRLHSMIRCGDLFLIRRKSGLGGPLIILQYGLSLLELKGGRRHLGWV
jgi:hypothetical protein